MGEQLDMHFSGWWRTIAFLSLFFTLLGYLDTSSVWGRHPVMSFCWGPCADTAIVLGAVSGAQNLPGPQMFAWSTAALARGPCVLCSNGDNVVLFCFLLRGQPWSMGPGWEPDIWFFLLFCLLINSCPETQDGPSTNWLIKFNQGMYPIFISARTL